MTDRASIPNRREQIINTAAELFFHKGYSMVSMQDIAEKIGLTKGALYNHIENKEELLYNILTRGIKIIFPKIEDILGKYDCPQERLKQIIYEIVLTQVNYRIYIYLFQQEHAALSAENYHKFIEYRDRVDLIIRDIIKEGIEKNLFIDLDIRLANFAILGMCNWITQWYSEDGETSPEEIAEFYSEMALRMVAK